MRTCCRGRKRFAQDLANDIVTLRMIRLLHWESTDNSYEAHFNLEYQISISR